MTAKQSSQMMETLIEKPISGESFVSRGKPERRFLAMEWFLYAVLGVSVFLFGGGFVEGYTLLQAAAAILITALFVTRLTKELPPRPRFDPAVFILLAWVLFLFAQLLPLPVDWVRLISPNLTALWEQFYPFSNRFDHISAEQSSQMALSLGAYGMRVEAGKACAYAAFFLAGYFLFRDKSAVHRLGIATVVIGTLLSVVGLIFYKVDPMRLYGIFYFEQGASFTPYLNKNHFANYLAMTLPVTLALACLRLNRSALFTVRGFRSKVLWFSSKEAAGFFMLLGCLILQFAAFLYPASRGAFLGLLAGMTSFGLLIFLRFKRKAAALFLAGFLALVIGIGLFQAKPLVSKLQALKGGHSEDLALKFRLSNWEGTFRMFLDFPIVGVGAGGFHYLFPKYKSLPEHSSVTQVRFYHAENELLEALAEGGVAGTALLVLLGAVLLVRFLKKWRQMESMTFRWMTLGMAAACVGMLAQSMVDFALHIPANAALFAVFGGVLAEAGRAHPIAPEEIHHKPFAAILRPGAVIIAVAVAFGAFYLVFPALWRQWRSEFFYLKAKEEFKYIDRAGEVELGRVLSAYDNLMKAEKAGAGQPRIHAGLGQAYFYLGLTAGNHLNKRSAWFEKAKRSFEQALSPEPFDAKHQHALGRLYGEWGKYKEAEPYFERARLLEPQNPFYHFQAGLNQLRLGEIDSAYSVFRRTLGINRAYTESVLILLLEFDPEVTFEKLLDRLTAHEEHRRDVKQQFSGFLSERGLKPPVLAAPLVN